MIRVFLALLMLAGTAYAQSLDEVRLDDVSKLLDMREKQLIESNRTLAYWKDACLSTPECGGAAKPAN